jgi:hypothetical protein
VYYFNGSRFSTIVPAKMNGSFGITEIYYRKSLNPTFEISVSSIKSCPSSISFIRKIEAKIDDLPAVVRPTIPTFDYAGINKLRFFSAGSR